jgi:hypothetical protein
LVGFFGRNDAFENHARIPQKPYLFSRRRRDHEMMRWITNLLDNAIDWMIPQAPAMPSPYDPFFQMVLDKVKWEFRAMGGMSKVERIGTRIYDYQSFGEEMRFLRMGEFTSRINIREDLYQVYHILARNGRHYLTVIFDAEEFCEGEKVLEVIEVDESIIQKLLANK